MRKLLLLIGLTSIGLFASSNGDVEANYDIVARTINFLIFIAIMYYLLADKVKDFLSSRSKEIKNRLDEVQNRLLASKKEKEAAQKAVEDAQKQAQDIISTAKKDAINISENIKKTIIEEIEKLDKHSKELMEVELKNKKREVVSEVIDSILSDDTLKISEEDIAKKLIKRVA